MPCRGVFILIVIPGPRVLFAVGRALAHGSRTALASVAGNAVEFELVAVTVALGIGTLVQRSAPVFTVVKLAGAGYLIWLGIRAIALVSDSAWCLLASAVRAWFARSPGRLQLIGGAGGLAMIVLGLSVAVTGRTK